MSNSSNFSIRICLCALMFSTSIHADGFIEKEVFSYKDKHGNLVFTDRKPPKSQAFKTQIVESANSTGATQTSESSKHRDTVAKVINTNQTIRIVVDQKPATKKKSYKKKNNKQNRCKSYQKKFDYYSDKMNSGYKHSEYKKLKSNRKKYRELLFDNC